MFIVQCILLPRPAVHAMVLIKGSVTHQTEFVLSVEPVQQHAPRHASRFQVSHILLTTPGWLLQDVHMHCDTLIVWPTIKLLQ